MESEEGCDKAEVKNPPRGIETREGLHKVIDRAAKMEFKSVQKDLRVK